MSTFKLAQQVLRSTASKAGDVNRARQTIIDTNLNAARARVKNMPDPGLHRSPVNKQAFTNMSAVRNTRNAAREKQGRIDSGLDTVRGRAESIPQNDYGIHRNPVNEEFFDEMNTIKNRRIAERNQSLTGGGADVPEIAGAATPMPSRTNRSQRAKSNYGMYAGAGAAAFAGGMGLVAMTEG